MRVNLYTRNDGLMPTGAADDECASNVILSDCFPGEENDGEYYHALDRLSSDGRYWGGGGAAPLFLMTIIRE